MSQDAGPREGQPEQATTAPGWLRRNRWGLVALPLAAAAALVASSDRVHLYFWDQALRRPQSGVQGSWVDFRASYHDSEGEHPLDVGVRLDEVAPAARGWESATRIAVPAGGRALKVRLTLRADPDLPLSVCSLALRDSRGTRYDYLRDFAGMDQPVSPCVPPDARGPYPAMGDLDTVDPDAPAEPRRPGTWTVEPVIIVPDDAEITEVSLWWELPDYVALTVSD